MLRSVCRRYHRPHMNTLAHTQLATIFQAGLPFQPDELHTGPTILGVNASTMVTLDGYCGPITCCKNSVLGVEYHASRTLSDGRGDEWRAQMGERSRSEVHAVARNDRK